MFGHSVRNYVHTLLTARGSTSLKQRTIKGTTDGRENSLTCTDWLAADKRA